MVRPEPLPASPLRRLVLAALAGLALLLLALPAAAQLDSREAIALRNQIDRLRAEVGELRAQMRSGNGGSSLGGSSLGGAQGTGSTLPEGQQQLLARLLERVEQMDTELRALRGRVEETEHATARLTERVEKGLGDLDFRMQQLEGTAPAQTPGQTPGATPAPGTGTAPAPGELGTLPRPPASTTRPPAQAAADPDQVFEAALARFRANDFAAATTQFQAFLERYPRHPRAAEAIYRLGEAQLARRQYRQAVLTFDDSATRFARGPRVQESILMRGVALSRLGERGAACQSYAELARRFPQMKRAVREQLDAERGRLNCR